MDRATYEQLDRIEEQNTEILSRTWLLLEKIRPDVIEKLEKQKKLEGKKE